MTRDLRKRIKKLQSQIPPQPSEQDITGQGLQRFLVFAIAYYLGEPTEEDTIASACARGLGYARPFEFRNALERNDAGLSERYALANTRLFAKFGVSTDDDGDAIWEAFDRMACGLPQSYKQKLRRE